MGAVGSNSEISSSAISGQLAVLETALQRNEKLALVGRVAASVMHEINNPAEAISNLTYLISKHADDSALVTSLAEQIEQQLVRIQYVARQMLSFFRETSRRQNTDLVAVIETALLFHDRLLKQKKIEIRRRIPDRLFATIFPGDFLQLVCNMVGNAIEALGDEGVLCIRLRSFHGFVRLTISDNGTGIPDDLRPRLFEPFQTTKAESGNGLGLWICKSVAEKHGGHITWRSTENNQRHGTTFRVSLAA